MTRTPASLAEKIDGGFPVRAGGDNTAAPAAPPEMTTSDLIANLAQAVAVHNGNRGSKGFGFKHDSPGAPMSVGFLHGPGGHLSFPGVDNDVFHTVVGSHSIMGQLPAVASLFTNPTFAVITGVQSDVGTEKTAVCDDAPVAGLMKSCMLTSVFGRYERQTQEIEINRLGARTDRADPMDLAMVGSPIASTGIFTTGPGDPSVPGDVLSNEISARFWELGVSLHRLLSQQLWSGNPSNNNGEAYKELTGFPLLVNTGHTHAETGIACPAVDSDVRDWNYGDVESGGTTLVETIADQYNFVRDLAVRTGVMPVRWVFAMRPELFYELTKIWPCAYLTYQCELTGNARVNIDAADQVQMREDMRAGLYLLIDGQRIPVVIDDGIAEATTTTDANVTEGCFASDIYLIPMSVQGGRAVTFLEYFQYNNPAVNDALGNMALGRIEGPWITVPKQTNWCLQWQTKIEPRLVLRTPWLAARLQNVMYCPAEHTRQPFPDDPYFVNGGRTSRDGPSFFSVWQT